MSVSLSPPQLEKPYHSNHEFCNLYKDRGERFLDKIEKEEPFELTDGSFVTINKNSPGIELLKTKRYKELGGGKKLFNDILSLSNFKKTEEFGAGGGQGAGTKNTAIQESTQCVFNALSTNINKGLIKYEDVTFNSISASYQYCRTSTPLEEVYEFSTNPSWIQSFITSSNVLYSYISSSEYTHHRDSPLIKDLYNTYKITNANFQSDKWNPGDIWFVKDCALNTRFSASLYELNMQIKDLFLKQDLIGVSLKKLGKEPKLEVKNINPEYKKKYNYVGFKTTKKSKDIKLIYNDGVICFRTFNFGTNWAGEIVGKTANHGKIGFGPINNILSKLNIEPLPHAKELKVFCQSPSNIPLMMKLFDNFIGLEDNFDIFISEKNIDWRLSKLFGLLLLERIEKEPKDIQDKLITELISYASSELDESSVFLKLS